MIQYKSYFKLNFIFLHQTDYYLLTAKNTTQLFNYREKFYFSMSTSFSSKLATELLRIDKNCSSN